MTTSGSAKQRRPTQWRRCQRRRRRGRAVGRGAVSSTQSSAAVRRQSRRGRTTSSRDPDRGARRSDRGGERPAWCRGRQHQHHRCQGARSRPKQRRPQAGRWRRCACASRGTAPRRGSSTDRVQRRGAELPSTGQKRRPPAQRRVRERRTRRARREAALQTNRREQVLSARALAAKYARSQRCDGVRPEQRPGHPRALGQSDRRGRATGRRRGRASTWRTSSSHGDRQLRCTARGGDSDDVTSYSSPSR
mmetsp:Transcript_9600/g.39182  ORF Transcript_9600/g.39182 Transcript_9600/m.39182 type:complete len:249 (-) Transcript_9600:232-978(-)